ncbi:hypothetical protein JCM10207_001376 [Rhodosporidiobolus poonsookiae]
MPAPLSLPIIDISPLLTAERDPAAVQLTGKAVHDACLRSGFFYLTGFESVVSQEDLIESLNVARGFLGRPQEEKDAIRIRPEDGARGYQRFGENKTLDRPDAHEGWDAYKEFNDGSGLLHGPNLWPAEPEAFRPVLERWIAKMHVLGMALMEATAVGLGLDLEDDATGEWARLKEWVKEPFWVMRTIGYPPLAKDAEGVSCGAHKDYGNWTLLHADSTPGALQVFLQDPSGTTVENGARGTWINADPLPNTMVVNIGEMVEIYSAGLYKATLHRVIHNAPNYRVSIPFFYEPSFDAVIEPLPSAIRLRDELLGAERPPLPKSQHYGRFLESKVSNNFYTSPSS